MKTRNQLFKLSAALLVSAGVLASCTDNENVAGKGKASVYLTDAPIDAENVTGVVQIRNGGTGATTVLGAKTNLGLENVDNTRDINKPISSISPPPRLFKNNNMLAVIITCFV